MGDLEKRLKEFEKELQDLKIKYKVEPIATIEFPQYKLLPDEVILALKVIQKHEYKIMLSYKDLKE